MNKTALVTGATKGIGKAIATRLLHDGWTVIATYASDTETALDSLAGFCAIAKEKAYILQADISNMKSIDKIDSFLKKNNFTLDTVVFNAGITYRSSFQEIDFENWSKVFAANVNFPVFLLQKIFPLLNVGGSITFTGSLMAMQPHAQSLAYGVSKAAVHALVKNLVKFFAEKQIRVNAVAPGFIESEWHNNKPAEIRNNIIQKLASERFGTPEEVSEVFVMLINNHYMNGEVVVCDGGYNYK